MLGTAEKSPKVGSEVKATSCNNLPHGESQEDVQDWGQVECVSSYMPIVIEYLPCLLL